MLNPKQDTNLCQRILELEENLIHKGKMLLDFISLLNVSF